MMPGTFSKHNIVTSIGITIQTTMTAAIVFPNIDTGITAAFCPLIFILLGSYRNAKQRMN
jgi:hypothetical protein